MLNITSVKITGNKHNSGWVQVHEFKPESQQSASARGVLMVIVSTKFLNGGVGALSLGRDILNRIGKEYYEDKQTSAYDTLKGVIQRISDENKNDLGGVEIIASSFVDGVVYAVVAGGGQVVILRDGMLATILAGSGSLVSASGHPKDRDILLLGTKSFFDNVPSGVLKANLESGNRDAISDSFASFAFKDQGEAVGAAIVLFHANATPTISSLEAERFKSPVLTNQLQSFVNLVKKRILAKIPTPRGLPVSTIRVGQVNEYEAGKKKTTITVGVILLLLLLISIGFGIRQRNVNLAKGRYELRLNQALKDFNEAGTLLTISPERSRELYLNSHAIVDTLQKEGVKDDRLNELSRKLAESQGVILGEFEGQLENFVDLGLLSSGFVASDLASSGEDIFAMDASGRKVARISISSKRAEIVAGPEDTTTPSWVAAYQDRPFLLIEEGIKEVGGRKEVVIQKDWEGEAFVYSYAGNLYVLDKGSGNVWRYPAIQGSFGGKQRWLGAGVNPDFSNAVSFAIDGSVWVLLSTGKILKFGMGSPESFTITAMTETLNNPVNLYTNEELSYLYILDPQSARMVVVDKKGIYKSQYKVDELKNATDLVVSEKTRRAIFLVNGNLKSLELKHL